MSHRDGNTVIAIAIVIVIALGLAIGGFGMQYGNPQTMTCHVVDKDHIYTDQEGAIYRVYTDNCDVLEIRDSIFFTGFDSASKYAKIIPGVTYKFATRGYRVPLVSIFPLITRVENV